MPELDFSNLSQSELAHLMGVDRTTIRSWTQKGMPYREPIAKGGKAGFCSAVCVHWHAGHRFSERSEMMNVDLSPLEKAAVGWLVGSGSDLTRDDESLFLAMMASAGASREQALLHLEYARGLLDR